jgi:UDP-N-acetylglucosamine--dolichyl-phosphate N-acetylglucosaminephosphotransferase
MNKYSRQKVSGSGGIVVVLGFLLGVLLYVAYLVFYIDSKVHLVELFALMSSLLILALIGFIDDLLGWQHGGLSRRSRIVLVAIAAIPLVVINAGKSSVAIPFFGTLNLGLIYPFIVIPIGIVGATTTFNFLAGFNGLESGQGILILTASAVVAYLTGSYWLVVIALCMVVALSAFLIFNFFPARVFPGDALTYTVGGLIAILCILGNYEKIAVFFFIPTILEFLLKARGKFIKQSFGKPAAGNFLELNYQKLYSLNHVAIAAMNRLNIRATERRVVFSIWAFQIIVILLGFIIFRGGLYL